MSGQHGRGRMADQVDKSSYFFYIEQKPLGQKYKDL